jgi:hypothetical protein
MDQVLLDIAGHQLDFEIIGVCLGDFFKAEEDWLEPGQVACLLDLGVQTLKFIEWIQVLRAHPCIVH